MKQRLIEFYLDWFNNFLTVQAMADHYGMELEDCKCLIELGRKHHHEKTICNEQPTNT